MAVGIGWLVVAGASAIYGFSKVSECSDAKQQRDAQYGARPLPRPPIIAPTPSASDIAPAPAAGVDRRAPQPRSLAMRPSRAAP
jgi:hypothetical protein